MLDNTTPEIDPALAKKFRFDAATLAANRKGKLTDAQRKWLRYHPLRQFVHVAMPFAISMGIVSSCLLLGAMNDPEVKNFPLLVILFIALIGMPIAIGISVEWVRSRRDLEENQAWRVFGRVRWLSGKSSSLMIGSNFFEMSRKDYMLFRDGAQYQIYFARHTNKILSVERLKD